MLGELPPEPVSLFNRAVAGRGATPAPFDVDVSRRDSLWLIVAGERLERAASACCRPGRRPSSSGPAGAVPLVVADAARRVRAARRSRSDRGARRERRRACA